METCKEDKLKIRAFTLAEVLITLGVIGVVAAMTLPTVINQYNKIVTVTRLQKSYTVFSQAIKMAEVKYGPAREWPDWNDAEIILDKYIIPELDGAKKYGKVSNERRAMCYDASQKTHNSGTDLASPYIWMNNGWYIDSPFFARATASVRLNDSSCIGLNPTVGTGGQGYYVFIDINGSNSPNVAGEDLFFFIINEKSQLVPLGMEKPYAQISGTNSHGTCNRKAAKGLSPGMYCAARIMSDGWRMKY